MEAGAFARFLDVAVLRVDGVTVTGADIVAGGVLCGEIPALEQRTAAGSRGEPGAPEVRDEVVALRRGRRLISGSDFRRWLAQHGLSVGDVDGYAARAVVARRADPPPGPPALPAADLDLLYVDGLCDETFRRSAMRVVDQLLAQQGTSPVPAELPATWSSWVGSGSAVAAALDEAVGLAAIGAAAASREASRQALAASLATDDAIDRCLAQRAGEWERVELRCFDYPTEGAAREAALLLREPGGVRVAERFATSTAERSVVLADAGDPLSWELLRSRSEPSAPVWPDADRGWHAGLVRRRHWPAAGDPEVVVRATASLLAERLDTLRPGRVTVLVPVW